MSDSLESWGRYPRARQRRLLIHDRFAEFPEFTGHGLPRGNGRSYGDVCLDDGGTLLDATGLDRFMAFDAKTGALRCEAGMLLGSILDTTIPAGWFLPVVPGTQFVTVGGAISNDVHGKNHHAVGSFGCHVRAFELLRSDGNRLVCTPTQNADWFAATIGGLGLTGIIIWAELQLRPVHGAWFDTETMRFDRLADFFDVSAQSERDYEYTVAWVDCTASGRSVGRGIFTRGNHASELTGVPKPHARHLRMPFTPPFSLVNEYSARAFNFLHFHRASRKTLRSPRSYREWLFPLDGIGNWNRMYGPGGLLQFQCVLPPANAYDGTHELLKMIVASGCGSFLAVLKQLGQPVSPGLLSFARPGTTLAVDFANHGRATLQLLDRLDDRVAAAGGAVYPAKDARMPAGHFQQYFPAWQRFEDYLDPTLSSGFWRRVSA